LSALFALFAVFASLALFALCCIAPPRYLRVLLTLDLFLGPGERTRRWIFGPANLQTRRHAYARLQEQRVQNTCV
jgi:hypothetical protein